VVGAVVVLVAVFAVVQLLRPLPPATFHSVQGTSLLLPGTAPSLPWPTAGSAAMSEGGVGSLGQSGSPGAVPIASIAKVLTAYVVLQEHPLAPGEQGPSIAVPPDVISDYQSGTASQQSEVLVSADESLTELQALQGLLIASGNDMADLLAEWDAGSTAAFVAKLNGAAKTLGLSSTHVTDPSGFDPATVSTPDDLVRLGQAAMGIAAFRQIVGTPQVTLPVAGLIYNFDYDLGHDGIVGIKTGSDGAAGGCFLFEAQRTVSGKTVTVTGVVLGQPGTSMLTAALSDAEGLATTALGDVQPMPLVAPGRRIGSVVAPWGASVAVDAPGAPTVLADPGLSLAAQVRGKVDGSSVPAGDAVGVLRVETPGHTTSVTLRTAGALPGPGIVWRLTRF
jgi:serine-type D-Ala-D-Ala carboxypeptidase (penicillin-binding protein 5/6)